MTFIEFLMFRLKLKQQDRAKFYSLYYSYFLDAYLRYMASELVFHHAFSKHEVMKIITKNASDEEKQAFAQKVYECRPFVFFYYFRRFLNEIWWNK